ncbi:hypothetical protein BAUCODRAFT_32724 [Baudoinia panamericana UAMH 10762]|uniref:Uncharacterized protein n=1 Tax=Baudoinia panamericana (strain UAMH 10762) TaxID=717646 RepID=M2NDJ2_BAUPA|nr:uncharacterized protein BAUCODRAFT_32724 [Baudoinia panamericana UAMH 10762]EMC96975.1 hypothetical protein BAUCODRAFT_32724 [Baudoinia panamericana UAMH 10762]
MRQTDRHESASSSQSPNANAVPAAAAAGGRVGREDSAYFSMGPLPFERDGRRMDWVFETGSPPDDGGSIGNGHRSGSTVSSFYSDSASRRESNIPRRESNTLPHLFRAIDELDADAGAGRSVHDAQYSAASSSRSPIQRSPSSYNGQQALPPPALPPDSPEGPSSPATPATYLGSPPRRQPSTNNRIDEELRPQTSRSVRQSRGERSGTPLSPGRQDPTFEKKLFRNAAILCDVRGTMVEYAQAVPDEPDPRFNTEMKEACKECRVCVIRKRENREHAGTKVVTSVWTLSDDGTVRLQHKLSEVNETVPFGSYFDPRKVSLAPADAAADSHIQLKFHNERWGEEVQEEKKTNWLNYVFVEENDAVAFQSAVFGRTLLGSFRTTKTIVIHEGIGRVLAFEEQFANIEMLRLWEDDGVSTPGATGGVMALMHVSSNFGEGWARWWINSSKQQVRVKEDGSKWAKVKGIDITVIKPGTVMSTAKSPSIAAETLQRTETELEPRPTGGRRIPVKKVTGVRIEFKTEDDRNRFVSQTKKLQEKMIPLPDL